MAINQFIIEKFNFALRKMSKRPLLTKFVGVFAPIGLGIVLMNGMTATDEDILRKLPDNERQMILEMRKTKQQRPLQDDPESNLLTNHARMTAGGNGGRSNTELVSLFIKQNLESSRPAWDLRPVELENKKQNKSPPVDTKE